MLIRSLAIPKKNLTVVKESATLQEAIDILEESGFRCVPILDETGISPWRLTLEITETAFAASYETVNETVGRLRKLGISFAIDDFGTGHSSLARERMLNVDYVKLDKFFVDDLLVGNKKQSIIGEIISMQHKMGFKVIAEGVEYDEQKAYLEEHGCDYLQGYLLSRPLARESVLELLAKTNS